MMAEKKTWKTPELTVLLRCRPEEAVLAGCKFANALGPYDPLRRCKRNSHDYCNDVARS